MSWTARVWKSPMHARLERLSIHCSSLSCAFVHQKGDYSVNPALCHSRVCISKSTNINVVMYEEAVSARVCLYTHNCSLPLSVSYVEWQRWCLQKIITYGTNVIMTHSLFWLQPLVPYFTICVVHCVSVVACSRKPCSHQLQWEPLIERVCSDYGYHVSASSATSHFLQMP